MTNKQEFPPLNVNPVHDGVFVWRNVKTHISPDFSCFKIKQGDQEIIVPGNFFTDIVKIMEKCYNSIDQEEQQSLEMFWNMMGTTWTLEHVEIDL